MFSSITIVVCALLSAVEADTCPNSKITDEFSKLDCSFEVQESFCCWRNINWILSSLTSENHAMLDNQSKKGTLTSEEFQGTGQDGFCLHFYFYLEGANSTLRIFLNSNHETVLWNSFANLTHPKWEHAHVVINIRESFVVIFEAERRFVNESLIWIDEIKHTTNCDIDEIEHTTKCETEQEIHQGTHNDDAQNDVNYESGDDNIAAIAGSVTAAIIVIVIVIVAIILLRKRRMQTCANCDVDHSRIFQCLRSSRKEEASHSVKESETVSNVVTRETPRARNVYSVMRISGQGSEIPVIGSDYSEIHDPVSTQHGHLYYELQDIPPDTVHTLGLVQVNPFEHTSRSGELYNTCQLEPAKQFATYNHIHDVITTPLTLDAVANQQNLPERTDLSFGYYDPIRVTVTVPNSYDMIHDSDLSKHAMEVDSTYSAKRNINDHEREFSDEYNSLNFHQVLDNVQNNTEMESRPSNGSGRAYDQVQADLYNTIKLETTENTINSDYDHLNQISGSGLESTALS